MEKLDEGGTPPDRHRNHEGVDNLHKVRIHIDREPYETVTPITGAALYELARIGPHRELFREATGDNEDEVIARSDALVDLTPDEHFYSQKDFVIVVNARPHEVAKRRLGYADVVALAFPGVMPAPNVIYTVIYRNGPDRNPKGTLMAGESVVIKDGMTFNVTQTNRS
jgi:hypothetical protein